MLHRILYYFIFRRALDLKGNFIPKFSFFSLLVALQIEQLVLLALWSFHWNILPSFKRVAPN